MDNVTKFWIEPLPPESPFLKPFRFHYIQNGKTKNWDLLRIRDCVSIVIFNKSTKKLVFVKQFRPSVYFSIVTTAGEPFDNVDLKKYPPSLGVTLELCGGMVDKNISLPNIAREEVLEECGFDISEDRLKEVYKMLTGVSPASATHTLYYCEVCDCDRRSDYVCEENIETVELSVEEVEDMLKKGAELNSPPSFVLGVMWFLSRKYSICLK